MKNIAFRDAGYIILVTENGWEYEIPERDMFYPELMAEWFSHMAIKKWVTKDHIRCMGSLAQEVIREGKEDASR